MDFNFDLNEVFSSDISIVDGTLIPSGTQPVDVITLKDRIAMIIDVLGSMSSRAQGLRKIITSAARLEFVDHKIYILTDLQDQNGHGSVIGFLKVGRKSLFVYDVTERCREVEPLCILDFYICENKQRRGYGKKLYDFMLQKEGVSPGHIAIDRPSDRFITFLKKHYKLTNFIPQPNHFVVFGSFFKGNPVVKSGRSEEDLQAVPVSSESSVESSVGIASESSESTAEDEARPGPSGETLVEDVAAARRYQQASGSEGATSAATPSGSPEIEVLFHRGQPMIGRYAAPRPPTTMASILQDPVEKLPQQPSIVGCPL